MFLTFCLNQLLPAQGNRKTCLTDILQQQLNAGNPGKAAEEQQINQQIFDQLSRGNVSRGGDITIPVVVHIIHQGGPENITNAQIIQGIEDLNQAFSNSGNYQQPNGVNTHIQFCLAQQDPNGNITTGIGRYVSALTNLNAETQDAILKNYVHRDPTRYLNIWLVNEITSSSFGNAIAGYAFMPSSHGSPEDGIVNEARWFGSTPDNSKVHIHEVGHYLGLYHTFNGACINNNCLLDGDRICDTPPDASASEVFCNSQANTCNTDSDDPTLQNPFRSFSLGGIGDQPDLFINYMDYGFQSCQNSFTDGQSIRMNAALAGARSSLTLSDRCNNACLVLASVANGNYINMIIGESFNLQGFATASVTTNVEWLVNGTVQGTGLSFSFSPAVPGIYTIAFRVYNTAVGCFNEKVTTFNVKCGTQISNASASPSNPDLGEPVHFTGYPSGAVTSTWYINGNLAGDLQDLNYSFIEHGENIVLFITSNGLCADTSRLFIPVGGCNRGEALTWWFGAGNTLSFYGPEPVQGNVDPTPSMFNQEGVASICDVNGNLILFTDGIQVFNGQGNQLTNGSALSGGSSSSQAAIIVPNPSYNGLYNIFTTGPVGFRYSVADVNQNIITVLNEPLISPVSEKQSAVKHCNGHDIWVITKQYNTNAFYAYLVTDSGVNSTPVISFGGPNQDQSALGCMKFSPDGDKLAMAVGEYFINPGYSLLFDFDNATGMVGSFITIPGDVYTNPYGVEFSPDGSKLYIGNNAPFPNAGIYQYDLSSGNGPEIVASRQLIGNSSNAGYGVGSLQLAKNERIYIARSGEFGFLDEIRNPDNSGFSAGFIDKSLAIQDNNHGLPNMVTSYNSSQIPYIHGPGSICPNSIATYSVACGHSETVSWSFTGPATLDFTEGNSIHISAGNAEGSGLLIATRDAGCLGLLKDTFNISIGFPGILLGTDTSICNSVSLRLSPGAGYSSYLWNDGSTMSYLNAGAGNYWVEVSGAGGCILRDSIAIAGFDESFSISLGNDTSFCQTFQSMITLNAPSGNFSSYQWSNGVTAPSVTLLQPSIISLAVTNENGCVARDTISVTFTQPPVFHFQESALICPGGVVVLETGLTGVSHRWPDFSDLPEFTAWQPGVYWANVTNSCGQEFTDSVTVLAAAAPSVDLGNDTVVCPFIPYLLQAGNAGNSYTWQDGSAGATHLITGENIYSVAVTNAFGCSASDSIDVKICPTDLNGDEFEPGVLIYPNPAAGYFDLYSSGKGKTTVSIFNAAGALVYSGYTGNNLQLPLRISVTEFAAGIYAVKVIMEGKMVVKKLVISK